MKRVWSVLGRIVFWASWPALKLYLKRRATTRLLVIAEDKVLVVKGWMSGGGWQLPGGGRKHGEAASLAVVRELAEETHITLDAASLAHLGRHTFSDYGLTYTAECYSVELAEMPAATPGHEILACAWLPLEQLATEHVLTDVVGSVACWREAKNLVN